MDLLFTLLHIAFSLWLIISLVWWVYCAIDPKKRERFYSGFRLIDKIVDIGAIIGIIFFCYAGFFKLLSFIPLSWGSYSEGEFFSLRPTLSSFLALGSGIFLILYFSKTGKLFYKTVTEKKPFSFMDEGRIQFIDEDTISYEEEQALEAVAFLFADVEPKRAVNIINKIILLFDKKYAEEYPDSSSPFADSLDPYDIGFVAARIIKYMANKEGIYNPNEYYQFAENLFEKAESQNDIEQLKKSFQQEFIHCAKCGVKNIITKHNRNLIAKCGKCGNPLEIVDEDV
jgi:ribosomal protein S27AE